MNNIFDVFAESDYYQLLLLNEIKQQYENVTVCLDLFIKLMHEGIDRIWVNIRDSKGGLINSYFVTNFTSLSWNVYVAIDYYKRGFYNKYYVVNCMSVINYQRWKKQCELIAIAAEQQRKEQQRKDAAARLIGKQYNMFGGLD